MFISQLQFKYEKNNAKNVKNFVISSYSQNALEPHMSRETLEYHWGKHHRTYVENLNKQVVGTDLEGLSLEDIIIVTYNKGDILPAFNNAAQVYVISISESQISYYVFLFKFYNPFAGLEP